MSVWRLPMLAAAIAATAPVPALAGATTVIDNDEVRVLDVRLAPGEAGAATPDDADAVIMFLEGGRVRTIGRDGAVRTAARHAGDAVFVARGAAAVDTALGGRGVREVVVILKGGIPRPLPNPTALPLAFPRPGVVRKLDNDRLTVWNYRWRAGVPTPMHFHDKDVVIAFFEDGTLRSTATDGQTTDNSYKAGDIRFNKANRAHSETLITAHQSAMMVELK